MLPNPFMNLPALPDVVVREGHLTDDAPPANRVRRPSFSNENRFVLDEAAFVAAIDPRVDPLQNFLRMR